MSNFFRAARIGLKYRLRVVALLFCAVMVGTLWGANISIMYPLIEIVFEGQSPQTWADNQIATARTKAAEIESRIDELSQQVAAAGVDDRDALSRQLIAAQARLQIEQEAIATYDQLRPYLEQYLPTDPFQTLLMVVGLLLAGTILKSLFFIAHSILSDNLVCLTQLQLRKDFYRRMLRMDQSSFSSDGTSDLISRFTFDMESLTGGLKFLCGNATREPLKMLACIVGAAWISWRMLLFSLIVAPLGVWAISKLSRVLKHANRRAMEEMSKIYAVLEESFNGIQVVKAFTMERYERWRFHKANKLYYLKMMRIARYDSLTSPITELVGISTICLTLLAGAYLVLNQQTTLLGIEIFDRAPSLAAMMTFFSLLAGTSDPARKLSTMYNRLQRAAAASDRIYSLIDREPQVRDPENPVLLPVHCSELRFENLEFRYEPTTPVLEQIDLRIPFGETVAIVGPNGCGKSTLFRLLLRFHDPASGSIQLDGVDIRQGRLQALRRQIGLVTQEPILFNDTAYNNIRYGAPSATKQEVYAAAKKAHAHKFIESKLPEGYDTILGERATKLSGGQKQRIALARAILRNPPILLLDEATSQIDLESEQLIHTVLEQFVCNRTTLIITHRLSTLALADRVVVMDAGRILDVGTHDQLISRCEFYQRLHEMQLKESA